MNPIEHAYEFLTEARKVPSFACGDARLADPGKPVYCDGDCDGCRADRGACGRTKGGGWMIALIGTTHRDATCLEESNHEVLCDMLAAVDPEHTAWDTMACGHWAVGHVTHIIVDPANEAVLRVIGEAGCALADYPILSDDHHSALENEWHYDGKCGEGCGECESERCEAGCWGDGANGHEYTRKCAAATLEAEVPASPERDALCAALRGEMSDDASEEDDACDMLNEHSGYRAVLWGWQDGDFGLWRN